MLALINANRMRPPIGPVGLDYVAGAVEQAGFAAALTDLNLAPDPDAALEDAFSEQTPELVGISLRNTDDSYWPSGQWFVPAARELISRVRALTGAPVALGGVGLSIFARRAMETLNVDYVVHGDGEPAMVALLSELRGRRRFHAVPGLLWRDNGQIRANPPAWPEPLRVPPGRRFLDNATYFRLGGQGGFETKRGCPRKCTYCADPLAKGRRSRTRRPEEVAEEIAALLAQGVDVLHTCDAEFNLPRDHALAVCWELTRRGLGEKVRWYAYCEPTPFDAELAGAMRQAGCAGINFTGDAASERMLEVYGKHHRREDLTRAASLCRDNGLASMFDLLLGGPGETSESAAETVKFFKGLQADCVGAALGMRVYPGTAAAEIVAGEGPMERNPSIRRHHKGPVDLFKPTFYISAALGDCPAALVRDLIDGDERFFEPSDGIDTDGDSQDSPGGDHNYNDSDVISQAIARGERGAYWHILHKLRGG